MITGYNATDYIHAIFRADPADNLTDTLLNISLQNLVTIFRRPHDMITMIENAVLAFILLHAKAVPSEDRGFKPEEWILNGILNTNIVVKRSQPSVTTFIHQAHHIIWHLT